MIVPRREDIRSKKKYQVEEIRSRKEMKPFHQQALRTKLFEGEGNVMNMNYVKMNKNR